MAICLKSQQDCSTYTVAQFKVDIQTTTGVSSTAVNVIAWQCGSITVTFTILGSNSALIAAAVAAILAASAPGGALYNALGGITFAGSATIPTTVNSSGHYHVAYCSYYPCPSTLPFNPSYARCRVCTLTDDWVKRLRTSCA